MSKWLNKFLPDKNGPDNTDKPDRFDPKVNMSVLSVLSEGPAGKNLGNIPETNTDNTDNTDRFDPKTNMSVLSVLFEGPAGKNLGNIPETNTDNTDNTDRFDPKTNMSVLSVLFDGPVGKNLRNISETNTDNTDRFDPKTNMSVLSVLSQEPVGKNSYYPLKMKSLFNDYEERVAIAEYDGHQPSIQAHRLAYLDAFISLLSALAENESQQDWLAEKIQTALATLEAQNFPTLN